MHRVVLAVAIALLASSPVVGQEKSTTKFGQWTYAERVDPMSDENTSYVMTGADEGEGILMIRCMSDGMNVQFGWGSYLGDRDDRMKIEIRFGADPALPAQMWDTSTGNESAFSPLNRVPAFLAASKAASSVTLRATDGRDGERKTSRFSFDGFSQALAVLKCTKKVGR